MHLITIFLTALLILVQYPLWLGKGGWLRVWDMDQQVHAAHDKINELKSRNAKLGSEVNDLKDGTGAIEERARSELGMIKQDEIFVQILNPNSNSAYAPAPPNPELTAVQEIVAAAVPDEPPKKQRP